MSAMFWWQCLFGPKAARAMANQRRGACRVRLGVELLEGRVVPTTFTVTTSADDAQGVGNETSLRGVINEAESASGSTGAVETIDFAVTTVTLDRQVDITVPVIINGAGVTIQCPNASGGGGIAFEASGNVVTGLAITGVPGSTIGMVFGDAFGISNGNTVTGVTVDGFGGAQISLTNNNNVVQGSMIGVNSAGTAKVGGNDGLTIYGSGNTIGGAAPGQGNVVSGLTGDYAVFVSGAANTTIEGNFIGTDKTGTKPIGNAGSGVALLSGATNNTVVGNVISDNGHISATASYAGVDIGFGASKDNMVEGNFIGTDITGTSAVAGLANKGDGIDIFGGAADNVIGGSITDVGMAGGGNVISNNALDGVSIWDDDSNVTTDNVVEGNLIGTDITGTKAVPNRGNGVSVEDGAADNTIGATTPDNRNVISGNALDGVRLGLEPNPSPGEAPAVDNTVEGNYIGTDLQGQPQDTQLFGGDLANQYGVYIFGGSNNTIGAGPQSAAVAGAGLTALPMPASNIIAGNTLDGVMVASGTGNRISLNRIFDNARMGIELGVNAGIVAPTANTSSGPNRLQNYPILTSVTDNGGQTTIVGTLIPQGGQTTYWIEFYANSQLSATGNLSEGEWFLGAQTFTVGANGLVDISFTCATPATPSMLPGATGYTHVAGDPLDAAIAEDHLITAIAVDGSGNTSEFSPCRDILRNTVGDSAVTTGEHKVGGPASIAKVFQPNTILGSQLTLAQAAADCGASQFNWLQTYSSPNLQFELYEQDNQLGTKTIPGYSGFYRDVGPYDGIDPVMDSPLFLVLITGPGGAIPVSIGTTDGLPYYYNVGSIAGSDSDLAAFQGDAVPFGLNPTDMLSFYDQPSLSSYMGQYLLNFSTSLVGVPANGDQGTPMAWAGLDTAFSWQTDGTNATNVAYLTAGSGGNSPPVVYGGIFNVEYADPPPSPFADDQFVITAPSQAIPKGTFSVTVQVNDSGGNLDTSYNGSVSLNLSSAPSGGALAGTLSAPVIDGVATFTGLSLNVAGAYTLAAGSDSGQSASASIDVTAATHFSIAANPTTLSAGKQVSYTITALDAHNHPVPSYQGTVQLSSSDPLANFTGGSSVTFTAPDQGVVQVTATLATAGSQTLTVVDGTAPVTKSIGAAVKVTPAPSGQLALVSVSHQPAVFDAKYAVTVTAEDQYDNRIANYAGTVTFGVSGGAATLPASYKFTTADAGAHTFTITPTSIGALTLSASDGSNNGSTALSVVSAATRLMVNLASAGPVVAGVPFNITVEALDASNHLDVNFQDNLHFASAGGLSTDQAFTSSTGMQTFSVTLTKAGSQIIAVTDTTAGRQAIKGNSAGILVTAVASRLVLAPVSSAAPMFGIPLSVRVTAEDQYGNPASSYHGTVQLSVASGTASVPAKIVLNGPTGTFLITPQSLGGLSINATDGTNSGPLSVTVVSAATHLAISGLPAKIIAGQAFTITVSALTAAAKPAAPFQDVLHFTDTADATGLPADAVFAGANGQEQFSITLPAAGPQTIAVSDISVPGVAPASIKVSAGPANSGVNPMAQVSGPGVGVPGQPLTFLLSATETGAPPGASYTYRIDYTGTGQTAVVTGPGAGVSVSHVYPAIGNYTFKVTATDEAGDSSAVVTLPVVVTATALEFDPAAGTTTALAVGVPLGGGTIVITPTNAAGSAIAVSINGANQSLPGQPFTHLFVFGQTGVDVVKEVSATLAGQPAFIAIPALLFGGTGTNTLSAAGSSAANILIGGPGTNTLTGGTGRDILIGGTVDAAATLNAGSGGDILIAGSTSYDVPTLANLTALLALSAEWQRTDISYTQRVQDLSGTGNGGVNGSYMLDSQTVFPDQTVNHLGAGTGDDWFFISVTSKKFDLITGYTDGEVVTLE